MENSNPDDRDRPLTAWCLAGSGASPGRPAAVLACRPPEHPERLELPQPRAPIHVGTLMQKPLEQAMDREVDGFLQGITDGVGRKSMEGLARIFREILRPLPSALESPVSL